MLLEPREMFDLARIGYEVIDGTPCAVYSEEKCIELLTKDLTENDGMGREDAYEAAVEHYSFNVAGAQGKGYPIFR
jgi:hypothetical protein